MKNQKILCIYHRKDLDGWMSAGIVKKYYDRFKSINLSENQTFPKDDEDYLFFQGYHYGDNLNLDFNYFDRVIIVDISLSLDSMIRLFKLNNEKKIELVWIDHHKAKVKQLEERNELEGFNKIFGKRDCSVAACENTWNYYFDKKIPYLVKMLGTYDTFRHIDTEEEQEVFEFEYGSRSLISSYDEAYEILNENPKLVKNKIKKLGSGIYQYLIKDASDKMKESFEINIKEFKFLGINANHFDPRHFGIKVNELGYDGFVSFHLSNNQWYFSIRSETVDVNKIANYYGGGGHKGAAGFHLDFNELENFLLNK